MTPLGTVNNDNLNIVLQNMLELYKEWEINKHSFQDYFFPMTLYGVSTWKQCDVTFSSTVTTSSGDVQIHATHSITQYINIFEFCKICRIQSDLQTGTRFSFVCSKAAFSGKKSNKKYSRFSPEKKKKRKALKAKMLLKCPQ